MGRGQIPGSARPGIDRDGNVWITERAEHQVLKFTPDGRLLLELGQKGVAGDNTSIDKFNGPSDLVFAPNGEIFISDGESTNARVVTYLERREVHHLLGRQRVGAGRVGSAA